MKTELMSIGSDWLGATAATVTTGDSFTYYGNDWQPGAPTYTWYQPWTYTYSPSITLTMSEANYLRKMSHKNEELRKILGKFLPHIAVEMEL